MSERASSGGARAVRLLLKAIRGLPERERQAVLAHLVERALEPSPAKPQGVAGPSFITPAFIKELGGMAGGMLRAGQGASAIAGLYGIPEEAARAALHEAASNPEAPQPLGSILGLAAEGRSHAEAARELGIPKAEMTRVLDGLASSPLERRLGQALFNHARARAQASAGFAFPAPYLNQALGAGRPELGVTAGHPEGIAARIGRMLIAGCDVAHIANLHDLAEDAVNAALLEVAVHPDTCEPLASVLRLVASGRSRAEAAEELRIPEEEVTTALEELLPSPLSQRLTRALHGEVAVRSPGTPPAPWLSGVTVAGGSLGGGRQQMVPVRFPEPQYRRLKEWCGQHGFSMAVVVRGLVERFLDDQDRRAA